MKKKGNAITIEYNNQLLYPRIMYSYYDCLIKRLDYVCIVYQGRGQLPGKILARS